ncbi:uncharacterized protein [Lolium perenne]|uniref:uncharacterized protein n=1 Tax=Lolium perenne TaxID=4522 RepID=UPI003A99A9E0
MGQARARGGNSGANAGRQQRPRVGTGACPGLRPWGGEGAGLGRPPWGGGGAVLGRSTHGPAAGTLTEQAGASGHHIGVEHAGAGGVHVWRSRQGPTTEENGSGRIRKKARGCNIVAFIGSFSCILLCEPEPGSRRLRCMT